MDFDLDGHIVCAVHFYFIGLLLKMSLSQLIVYCILGVHCVLSLLGNLLGTYFLPRASFVLVFSR